MSLQNGLIHKGRAYLWSDTLVIDDDGNPVGYASKAYHGLNWPWAIIQSGLRRTENPHRAIQSIGNAIPRNGAELIELAREALRAERDDGLLARFLIAYADKEHGARMVFIANDETPFAAPLEPHETVQFACGHSDDRWSTAFIDRDLTHLEMRQFIAEQAKRPMLTAFGKEQWGIGGELIETRVTAKGVRSTGLGMIGRDSNVTAEAA
jgi:hypothetical protein